MREVLLLAACCCCSCWQVAVRCNLAAHFVIMMRVVWSVEPMSGCSSAGAPTSTAPSANRAGPCHRCPALHFLQTSIPDALSCSPSSRAVQAILGRSGVQRRADFTCTRNIASKSSEQPQNALPGSRRGCARRPVGMARSAMQLGVALLALLAAASGESQESRCIEWSSACLVSCTPAAAWPAAGAAAQPSGSCCAPLPPAS